jgi:hypothetical protein
MATIRARRQSDGTIRYTAIVRLRQGKTVLHYESKTFSQRSAASGWAKSREVALEDPSSSLDRTTSRGPWPASSVGISTRLRPCRDGKEVNRLISSSSNGIG